MAYVGAPIAQFRYPFRGSWGGSLGEYGTQYGAGLGEYLGLDLADDGSMNLPGGGALETPPIAPPGEPPPADTSSDQAPDTVASASASPWYTLPVEIFKTVEPVLVSAPQPVMAPIPTQLPPDYGVMPAPAVSYAGLAVGLAGLAWLLLSGKGKRAKRGGYV